MQILVVAATQLEIAPFIKKKLGTDILITGVGVPATMFYLQKKLAVKRYHLVIQAGIAGTFSNKCSLGEVVIAERDCFADIGALEKRNFTTVFETKLANANEFPYNNGWLVNANLIKERLPLPCVIAVTINTISDSLSQRKTLLQKFNADIETMEGAAFHYVCLQAGASFIQIRGISNKAGQRDKSKWVIKDAINNLNTELLKYLLPKL